MTANVVMFDALKIRRENAAARPNLNEQRIAELDQKILELDVDLTRLFQEINGRRRLRVVYLAELELRRVTRGG